MTFDPNPWDLVTVFVAAMDASAPVDLNPTIIDPPFHGEIADCWDVK